MASSSTSTTPARTIEQANVVSLAFSPLSTYLFTFERPVKSDSDVYRNVKAWNVQTGEEVGGWYQKTQDDWEPIITQDEAHLLRPTASDILIFTPPLAPRPVTRLKLDSNVRGIFLSNPTQLPEGTSSAKPTRAASEPAVAVWIGERKGAPASLALYTLSSLLGSPKAQVDGEDYKTENRDMPITAARKAFYKADKLQVKWNPAGTTALFFTQTDVDTTNKSYYGETNLYIIAVDGSFDGLVELDKEGPIYDFCWSPTSREFTVCYGYMPARIQLYDAKAKPQYSYGVQHRNFLLYQPQGRLLLTAGFGNLAGGVDIWDTSTRNKVAEFKAPNSTYCQWSPCGRYILTAILSPRLRVDNGVKIWWCGGQLLNIHLQDELYQASFRPAKLANVQPFPSTLPPAPAANPSVALLRAKGESDSTPDAKPKGVYRPPGARGAAAGEAFRMDLDDSAPSSGAATPTMRGGKPAQRYVPGRGVPGASQPQAEEKKKRVRTKRTKEPEAPVEEMKKVEINDDDANAKKLRNLNKKLKAIEELKERQKKGEVLEKTQLAKIETESSVRAEIASIDN